MEIGEKLRRLRLRRGLTQDELAARTELSKGFISQVERDQASPSIATLVDILGALGSDLSDFFSERPIEKLVFSPEDRFVKENQEHGYNIEWLVPNAQKNELEPILVTLLPGGKSESYDPHEGEEFGYVLKGGITLIVGDEKFKLKKGDSFCVKPAGVHYLANTTKASAVVLWISTPPSF